MTKEQEILAKAIFIPGEVPSSKNSKEIGFIFLKRGTPGKIFVNRNGQFMPVRLNLNHSKATKRYIKEHEIDYIANKVMFKRLIKNLNPPYRIVFKFIRKTKRKFDYINAAQIVQDMMVDAGWIEDDDCYNCRPYFIDMEIDKTNPGVYISVF